MSSSNDHRRAARPQVWRPDQGSFAERRNCASLRVKKNATGESRSARSSLQKRALRSQKMLEQHVHWSRLKLVEDRFDAPIRFIKSQQATFGSPCYICSPQCSIISETTQDVQLRKLRRVACHKKNVSLSVAVSRLRRFWQRPRVRPRRPSAAGHCCCCCC